MFLELVELHRQCVARQNTEKVASTVHIINFFTYVASTELCYNCLSGFGFFLFFFFFPWFI